MEIDVSMHGPIFQGNVPAKVIEAVNMTVKELVNEGEKQVDLQLYPGHGLRTGHYRRSVHGEMTSSLHGRVHDSRVTYGAWLEGISSRNQKSRFKGYAMFRNATQQLDRIKIDVLKKWVGKLVKDLS